MPRQVEKLITVYYFLKHRFFLDLETRRDVEDYQQGRLKKHISWIKRHSPFYAKHLQDPRARVDKAIMMENFDELNTAGLNKNEAMDLAIRAETDRDFAPMLGDVTVGLSSGTSGHRGLFLANAVERGQYAGVILAKALPKKRRAFKPKVALFLRANSNLYEAVRSKAIQFRFFDILQDLESQVMDLYGYGPTILIAQPSVLRRIIEILRERNLHLEPEVIYSAAEVLEPIDKAFIQNAFPDSRIGEVYQCTEGFLGITCEYGTMHLNEDLVKVEKEFLPGSQTKFIPILTDLYRLTQPIVNYRLNDVLTLRAEPCPCGSPLLAIESIDGRQDDILHFKKLGESQYFPVFADFIRNHILYIPATIKAYYVTQRPDASLLIQIDCDEVNRKRVETQVVEQMEQLAGKLGTETPIIEFRKYQRQEGFQKKMRRVVSEFSP